MVIAILAIGLYSFRDALLCGVARLIIVDEPSEAANYLLLLGGDHCQEQAVQFYQDGAAHQVLLIERRPTRLHRMGIFPSFTERMHRELASRRVPERSITVLGGDVCNDWDAARCLGEWVSGRPQVQVRVLCDRFASRRIRFILDCVLERDVAAQVQVQGLPSRNYDESNWWHDKEGTVHLFNSWVGFAYCWSFGPDSEAWHEWDPKQYEESLRP